MSNTETSSMLVRIGAWLQIPFSFFIIVIIAWMFWILWPIMLDPIFWTAFGWWTTVLLGLSIFAGILGLILALFWFKWRNDIPTHKNDFIKTGIVGMIFTGTVPGLLVLIGAAIHPSK
ncbi:MAG: hypothetical protein ACFFCF_08255 [Promethearchaeota archaeon]